MKAIVEHKYNCGTKESVYVADKNEFQQYYIKELLNHTMPKKLSVEYILYMTPLKCIFAMYN